MQWGLFLLILMGQCSFCVCHLYEYTFIGENRTWVQAQNYCRENHNDLATVYDMKDMKRLRDTTKKQGEAWIGLHVIQEQNRTWRWSLPGVEFREGPWSDGEPNDAVKGLENCVAMINYKWVDDSCSKTHAFICYNETKQSNKTFHFVNTKVAWLKAQNYCRENHTDLVSGLSQLNDTKHKNKTDFGPEVWIGLFRDKWRWSDSNNSSFRNFLGFDVGENTKCASVLHGSVKWNSRSCAEKKPFFCYDDKVILIKQSKTWDEALEYCREKYLDLVSITNLKDQRWVQERAKNASTPFVWLGLRYTCTLGFWFWVSDETVDYKNWASDVSSDNCDMSGAMERGGKYKWHKKDDTKKFNFICSV